ncbi:hypothetical protein [Pseudoxanthomonas sangjuensis]|uniref:hypothetical protein n=1 Tax=Pseudoxanthomonas sangjuensis TaxID=1503750 RepID=UPI001390FED2|nr:hypothetical protein [Pseudoxanthomonas sangjuensis]
MHSTHEIVTRAGESPGQCRASASFHNQDIDFQGKYVIGVFFANPKKMPDFRLPLRGAKA